MFHGLEGSLNTPIDNLDIDSVYSYLNKNYFKDVDTKFIANISDFLTVNKDKIFIIEYGYASLTGFEKIKVLENHFELRFEGAVLVVPKPCVVALVDTKDNYYTYYAITKDGKMLEIIIWI